MKWKKILTGTLAAAMLFSNASVANLTALAKETAVVSLESARETLGTLMNEAIEKVNIEKDGIKYSQASKDAVMVKYAAARKVKNNSGATEEQLEAAIKDLREALDNLEQLCKVTVDKRFTNDIKVTLTAEHAEYASENEDSAEFYVPLKEKVTVTTSEKDGNIPFSGWEMTVNNGGSSEDSGTKIVSNSTVYTFYVTGETHLEPVYGETDEKPAEEKGVERIHELGKLQGSKYVQSQMGSIYLEVKEKLNRGKIVYFSGTPCQVDGLIAFLGKEYDNLICQDIICHGVPSPKIWKQYLKQFNIEKNAKILFRDKRTGWESYSFTIDQREKYTQRASENLYMKVFLNNLCLRPSCYQCHSKGNFRKSDITLGDFWGVEKVCSEMYNEKGTSLILINSEKGKKIFGKIKRNLKIKEINIEEAIKYNESIYKSAFENKKREKFMSEIDKKKESFNNIAWKYVKDPVILRVKKKLYNLLNC